MVWPNSVVSTKKLDFVHILYTTPSRIIRKHCVGNTYSSHRAIWQTFLLFSLVMVPDTLMVYIPTNYLQHACCIKGETVSTPLDKDGITHIYGHGHCCVAHSTWPRFFCHFFFFKINQLVFEFCTSIIYFCIIIVYYLFFMVNK